MFFARALVAVVAAFALAAQAAPLTRRQIGDIQCNVDRLSIVLAMKSATSDVSALQSLSGITSSSANTAAVAAASAGLSSAQSGINTIGAALLELQNAPASARLQVQSGLNATQAALASISTTDSATTTALQKAQADVTDAIGAGNGVVANC